MTKKVLVIEDDQFIRDLYQRQLEKTGYEVLIAADGEAAFEFLPQGPNLILLDILLPKKGGLEVLKEIKENPNYRDIPVILLTNLGQEAVIKEGFSLGASGYLLKSSTTPNEVVGQVDDFLDHK